MSPDLTSAIWRKSTKSNGQNACVEVTTVDRAVAVRDSKDPTGPVLLFNHPDWARFIATTTQRHTDFA
ncbi:DUF397 domain-containing protein [Micromonospora sp. WMMD1082]|uniref:DUF397 domain-containing protein n=1 Tax=Micromonospora sp. WMMD1082 TaxID=3016104 RepID=UPI002417BA6D|nr:DUF397 domain-containing protein [Micromonospora sp. WMMD1082]MDG4795486.1 DUF397 domain-containing protein [Micromonospora sp. WMMD1082]